MLKCRNKLFTPSELRARSRVVEERATSVSNWDCGVSQSPSVGQSTEGEENTRKSELGRLKETGYFVCF